MFAHSKAWREGLYFQGEVNNIKIQKMFLILDYFSITKNVMVCNRTLNKFLWAWFSSVNLKTTKGEKICNGAVTKEIGSTTLQLCVNGKVDKQLENSPWRMNSPIYSKSQIMIDPFCPIPPLQVRLMPRKKVGEGFALVGRDTGPGKDCLWYGTTFCDGDLVEDLYRWWLKQKRYRYLNSIFLQMVVQDEVFQVQVHRCQCSLYSSGTGSKI